LPINFKGFSGTLIDDTDKRRSRSLLIDDCMSVSASLYRQQQQQQQQCSGGGGAAAE